MTERKYNSEYERLVMTTPHPQPQFKPLERPPYIHSWLEERWEEVVVTAFLLSVFCYCSAVYMGVYYTVIYPYMRAIGQAWDVGIAAYVFVKFAPLPRKARKRARRPLFALFAAVAAARWWYPSLYPSIYPWQPQPQA